MFDMVCVRIGLYRALTRLLGFYARGLSVLSKGWIYYSTTQDYKRATSRIEGSSRVPCSALHDFSRTVGRVILQT